MVAMVAVVATNRSHELDSLSHIAFTVAPYFVQLHPGYLYLHYTHYHYNLPATVVLFSKNYTDGLWCVLLQIYFCVYIY